MPKKIQQIELFKLLQYLIVHALRLHGCCSFIWWPLFWGAHRIFGQIFLLQSSYLLLHISYGIPLKDGENQEPWNQEKYLLHLFTIEIPRKILQFTACFFL